MPEDTGRCRHESIVIDRFESLDERIWCRYCELYLRGDDIPEGWLRDYWLAAKEAWGG